VDLCRAHGYVETAVPDTWMVAFRWLVSST